MPVQSKWQGLPTEAINPVSLAIDKTPVRDIIELLSSEARRHGVSVEFDGDEPLPLATVDVGGQRVVTHQTAAVGPVPENTNHDAEWLYLDRSVGRSPDMTISLLHPAAGGNPVDVSLTDPDATLGAGWFKP